MKHHELTLSEWITVREQIRAEHGDSMILLRAKMRRELGISPRRHTNWVPKMDGGFAIAEIVCIDFYTEQARTWFLLKFT